jgi:hypothetical protein
MRAKHDAEAHRNHGQQERRRRRQQEHEQPSISMTMDSSLRLFPRLTSAMRPAAGAV